MFTVLCKKLTIKESSEKWKIAKLLKKSHVKELWAWQKMRYKNIEFRIPLFFENLYGY